MKRFNSLALLAALSIPLGLVAGCDDDDSPEAEATEGRFEESAEDLGENLKDAGQDLAETVGAAGERTGQALKNSGDEVGEALENTGEEMQDADEDDVPPATRPTNPA